MNPNIIFAKLTQEDGAKIFFVACVLVVIFVLLSRSGRSSDVEEETEEEKKRRQASELKQKQHADGDFDNMCGKCGKSAKPIHGTGNRYACGTCGNKFAGDSHTY